MEEKTHSGLQTALLIIGILIVISGIAMAFLAAGDTEPDRSADSSGPGYVAIASGLLTSLICWRNSKKKKETDKGESK